MPLDDPDLVREAIRHWLRAGDGLDVIERQLIEPAQLSDDQKSGLWLYAWAALTRGQPTAARRAPLAVARSGRGTPLLGALHPPT